MKSKCVLAGFLALTIVAFACVASVSAQYDYTPYLTSTPGGVIWTFKTNGEFSGREIIKSSVVATYWIVNPDKSLSIYNPIPRQITLTDKLVTLVFDLADLPAHADGNSVSGTLTDGKTFLASGPGFAFARRPGG